MTVFTQWEKLVRLLARMAKTAARGETQYALNRIDLSTGKGTMADRSMNAVSLAGGSVTLAVPEATPGVAREFLLRAECDEATELAFEGADFEGENGDELNAPEAGETVVYFFTETAAGKLLVGRKAITQIDNGG